MAKRKRKWIKWTLLTVVAVLAIGAAGSYWMLRTDPDWYRPVAWDPSQHEAIASRAERKFMDASSWANRLKAQAQAAHDAGQAGSTRPAPTTAPDESATVTFGDDELNVLFRKWSQLNGWDQKLAEYVTDPVLVLRPGRLILAGKVKDVGAVASFHFEPSLDERGNLSLKLDRVLAGRLPMPAAVWEQQRDRMLDGLRRRMPLWQNSAAIAPNGAANEAAVSATMGKLLVNVLNDQPSEPVVFVESMPARLTNLEVVEDEMTLTVEPLTSAERTALLQRIREHQDTAAASAR